MECGSNSASRGPQQAHFRFFDLPGELRESILRHVVLFAEDIDPAAFFLQPWPANVDWIYLGITPTDLFTVCSQMYHEASAIFYRENTFRLDLGTGRGGFLDRLTKDGYLFSQQGRDFRRRIRSLALDMGRLMGSFATVIMPLLNDMILSGSLRVLELRFRSRPLPIANQEFQGDPYHNPALRAVLQLASDPDLEKVTIRVFRAHWTFWCPFHVAIPPDEVTCSPALHRRGMDWVEIDWRAMAQTYGVGHRITKIGD